MRKHVFLFAAVLACVVPVAAAAQDAGSAGELAQLLALEDRHEFDGATFQRLVQHPDALVRRYAAMVMGRVGEGSALPLLRDLLRDRDTLVRIDAVFALGLLGDRAAVADLAPLADRFASVTTGDLEAEVVTALAKLGGADAERALDQLLERHPASAEGSDRATAVALLEAWRLGRRSLLARRLTGYVRDARGEWRRAAVFSAGRLRLPEAAGALLEAATDDDAEIRAFAARALVAPLADSGGVPRDAFVSRLRTLAADAEAQVRINALRALASFGDSSLAPIAAARLTDRDPNVPVQAAATLGSLGGARAAATLVERFPGGAGLAQRRAMLVALAQIAPATALETGRAWRSDADWRYRAAWVDMLVAARTPAARQQLTELLADADARVVAAALAGLTQLVPAGDSALIAVAREKLTHGDVVVRTAAIDIIGRERREAFIRDLAAAYRRAEADVLDDARLAAVNALADIADAVGAARPQVEQALLAAFPRSPDYLVRRLAVRRFGAATLRSTWGPPGPVETGRTAEEYRELALRYVIGSALPGNVTIEMERGSVVLELYAFDAPLTVDNFIRLTDRRFYDNGRWHRVVPNFVVQDGDPRGDGSGGPGTTIRDEINRHRYDRGAVGMALSGPDTGGSQFFITHSSQPHLDGGYTVFGHVVAGWDVLDQIVQGDRIRRIYR
jgi:cyclophilin family peptidyl-prolyl cis-trans isomerase/HEAT repeat protein